MKEQIEENKAIEEELNRYVLTYGGLYEQQQAYQQKKQRAKAVLNLIHRQDQEHQEALKAIVLKMEEWKVEDRRHLKKILSLGIHQEQIVLKAVQDELQEYEQKFNTDKEELSQVTNHFYSLKYAELKKNHIEVQDLIRLLQNQLETLDQDEEIDEINDKLDENSQELRGYFLNEFEESNKRKREINIAKQPIIEQIEQSSLQMKSQGEQLELAKKSFYGNNGEIENIGKQMNRIKKRILSNPDQESVKEVIPVWEKRLSIFR